MGVCFAWAGLGLLFALFFPWAVHRGGKILYDVHVDVAGENE